MSADYDIAIKCLRENLDLLSDSRGNISPQNMPMWNLTNALIVICDSLRDMEARLRRIED
jgi:hypothetical protein